MKKIYFLLLLSFLLFRAKEIKAQYITLPDTNFRDYLVQNYSSCMNGSGQLDTVCTQASTITSIIIYSTTISDITGIQYFKKLDTLICSMNNLLKSLPALPDSLTYLDCSQNSLTSLPTMPIHLNYLNCSYNNLSSLPTLPDSLTFLGCTNNNLHCLPNIPAGIHTINAINNHITCLYDIPQLGYGFPTVVMDSAYQVCGGSNNIHNCLYAPNYVTLPDFEFALALQQTYPECMNISGQLDTTCSAVINATSLVLNETQIQNFTGINYFKNLDTFEVEGFINNQAINWSVLPSSITYLSIQGINPGGTETASLPQLPVSLRYLNCTMNDLSSLPALPASLTYLECGVNNLTTLPTLPSSLVYLDVSLNKINSLPALPASIDTLMCSGNQLTNLPVLPDSLKVLDCSENKLNCLPLLPSKLQSLQTSYNNITCYPNLPTSIKSIDNPLQICNDTNNRYHCTVGSYVSIPDVNFGNYLQANFPGCLNAGGMLDTTCTALATITTLKLDSLSIFDLTGIEHFTNLDTLDCSGNYLGYLPPLPPSLTYLNCSNNQLTSLPSLTDSTATIIARTQKANSLVTLNCQNNLLTCLPVLPNSLQTLQASGNQITCLVNVPASLITTDGSYPLCNSTNNYNGCTVQSVTGIASVASVLGGVQVYPNPSNGIVTINCPFIATGVKVCGMDGKTAYETTVGSSNYTLDLSGIAKGLYVAQVSSANGVVTQKLVIQ